MKEMSTTVYPKNFILKSCKKYKNVFNSLSTSVMDVSKFHSSL